MPDLVHVEGTLILGTEVHLTTDVDVWLPHDLSGGLRADQMRAGTQFCTSTENGNTAYVHIADIDTNARTITLDIVVWA